jgi:ABC-type glycerol-3-phosphate transport system permease component
MKKRFNRSVVVSMINFLLLLVLASFMLLPFIYVINNSLKPIHELFLFPPRLFVQNPTFDNFLSMITIMNSSNVPFLRNLFNTVFITFVGTLGLVYFASLAAFVLAKFKFPLKNMLFNMIVLSLMFAPQVTAIPNFITMRSLGWIDSLLSIIVPAFAMPLGLFLMKQFMETMVPDVIIESANIDGAGLLQTYFKIILPMVKPAWLTIVIFSIQSLWNTTGGNFIYSEKLKPIQYVLQQILAGGIIRTGVASAASVIMMIVPITAFILIQSNVVETMSTSGIKE